MSARHAFAALVALAMVAGVAPAQGADTLRLPLRWEITEAMSPVAESLGVLSGIAVDRDGNTYVSDRSSAKIWVFDAAGRSVRGIGRKGKGPGEFQSPTGLVFGPDGRLWVRDAERVSRFTTDPATGRLGRYESSFASPAMNDWTSDLASRFMVRGGFTFPSFNRMSRTTQHGYYHVFDAGGKQVDSIAVPPFPGAPREFAIVRLSRSDGQMLQGLGHVPFTPVPAWDVTPQGTVLWGDAKSYVIREFDRTGKLVREFKRTVPPDRIPVSERRDSTAALRERVDSLKVPRAQVEGAPPEVWALTLPQTYPAYMAINAGIDGRVWVRRWAANGRERSVFDVFEANGTFRTTVVVPRDIATYPTPMLSLEGIAAIGIDRETGAFTILRFGGVPKG